PPNAPCPKAVEIDIFEPGGDQFSWANFNEAGFHDVQPSCLPTCVSGCENFCPKPYPYYKVGKSQVTSASPLNTAFHNYAVEFLSDRIIYYFDKNPYPWVFADCPSAIHTVTDIMHSFDLHGQQMVVD